MAIGFICIYNTSIVHIIHVNYTVLPVNVLIISIVNFTFIVERDPFVD